MSSREVCFAPYNGSSDRPIWPLPWNLPTLSDFILRERMQIHRRLISPVERGSEVDLMTALYPLSVQRRIERQWAERIKGQIVVGTKRTLQPGFNSVGSEIRV